MSVRWITADVFDGLATLEDDSIDLVVTSPPFLALRSYLPADHPDKSKEIGSEATPAEFIDTLLAVTAELRRVLTPHGSICIELGDTYAGSGGAGGDYNDGGWREGQPKWRGYDGRGPRDTTDIDQANVGPLPLNGGPGWPLAKSRTLIPQLYEIALAYGINPLTGQPSPAGQWRIRNVVTWARPNPPVGALGDKWRPATSDLIVACTSGKRYWDDLATRREPLHGWTSRLLNGETGRLPTKGANPDRADGGAGNFDTHTGGAPLLDYWEIPPGGYKGSHYAVMPQALVEPLVKAMCPFRVCNGCGLALSSDHDSRTLRGVRTARRESMGDEVLFGDLSQSSYGSQPEIDQGLRDDPEGLQGAATTGSPNGLQGGLRDGAPLSRSGVHRSDAGAVGDRSSQERHQGRQPDRESGVDDQDAARSNAEAGTKTSPLSVVRQSHSDAPQCPACESRDLRPGRVLDCFAGSGTTLAVATGHGHDAIGIDLDSRNEDLARERIGPLMFEAFT